jgi:N-hydroxyarylamine O-acetyltransferase
MDGVAGDASRSDVSVDVERYLRRLGLKVPASDLRPTAATLAELQLAHMIAVPFENLHVVAGAQMRTDLGWSYPKVVEQGRGGWCFELNGAFGALLRAIGYEVTYLSASVWDPKRLELGPPLDHLCLVVVADDERWLVDVGFGDSALTPLRFDSDDEQDRRPRRGRIERVGELVHYLEWMQWEDWEVQYGIDLTPRVLADFQPRSDALAAGAGGGYFSTKPFATRALDAEGSRVWLLKDRLKRVESRAHQPLEEPVDDEDWEPTLQQWFGMTRPRI